MESNASSNPVKIVTTSQSFKYPDFIRLMIYRYFTVQELFLKIERLSKRERMIIQNSFIVREGRSGAFNFGEQDPKYGKMNNAKNAAYFEELEIEVN